MTCEIIPPRGWFEFATVTLVSRRQVEQQRKWFTTDRRNAFKKAAAKTVNYDLTPLWPYLQIHHIVPLSLGGGNEYENLTLIVPNLHDRYHLFIGSQTASMRKGEEKKIVLPKREGKLWYDVLSAAMLRNVTGCSFGGLR